jgi:hypothetical protein
MAATAWPSNADLIADCFELGYLHEDWLTLDPTYGEGVFWRKRRPTNLVTSDIVPGKADMVADFTALPFADHTFQAVVYDPPYKLNGTPTPDVDARYGVHEPTTWQDRMSLMAQGLRSCTRVLAPKGYLLVKCQNQVCSGKVRWQVDAMSAVAEREGLEKVDQLEYLNTPRPQPGDRRQVHARRNHSTLLVFRKP